MWRTLLLAKINEHVLSKPSRGGRAARPRPALHPWYLRLQAQFLEGVERGAPGRRGTSRETAGKGVGAAARVRPRTPRPRALSLPFPPFFTHLAHEARPARGGAGTEGGRLGEGQHCGWVWMAEGKGGERQRGVAFGGRSFLYSFHASLCFFLFCCIFLASPAPSQHGRHLQQRVPPCHARHAVAEPGRRGERRHQGDHRERGRTGHGRGRQGRQGSLPVGARQSLLVRRDRIRNDVSRQRPRQIAHAQGEDSRDEAERRGGGGVGGRDERGFRVRVL